MTRLFVALKIPDEIKKKIFELRNEILPEWGKYNWEKEDKIHLTLKFIGEVDDNKIGQISQSLNFIGNYCNIFSCSLYCANLPSTNYLSSNLNKRLNKLDLN